MLRVAVLILLLALLIAGAGCDDSTGPREPAVGDVTVVAGSLISGVGTTVLHHQADGSFVEQLNTTDGEATLEIRAGDMLTRYSGSDAFSVFLGLVDAAPGATINLNTLPPIDVPAPTAEVQLTGELPDGAEKLHYSTGCVAGETTLSLPYSFLHQPDCGSEAGKFDLVVWTTVADEKQAFAYFTDVQEPASGATSVELTDQWRTDWQSLRIRIPEPPFASIDRYLLPSMERGNRGFAGLEWEEFGSGSGADELEVLVPGQFPERIAVSLEFNGPESESAGLVQRVDAAGLGSSLTLREELPRLHSLELDYSDPLRPRLSWGLDEAGHAGDMIHVFAFWITEGGDQISWDVYLPPDRRSFRFPELPSGVDHAIPPQPSTTNGLRGRVEFVEASTVQGFAEVRRHPERARASFVFGEELGFEMFAADSFRAESLNGATGRN